MLDDMDKWVIDETRLYKGHPSISTGEYHVAGRNIDFSLYGKNNIKGRLRRKKELKLRRFKIMVASGEIEVFYDTPVVEKELNGEKVMLYEAWGIPKNMITYETEFVNKTKQTYLNIKGEFKNEMIGFENDLNVCLRIDTDVYDGYEVHVEDGLVTVILHEIKNEAPVLKDYGVVEDVEEPPIQ